MKSKPPKSKQKKKEYNSYEKKKNICGYQRCVPENWKVFSSIHIVNFREPIETIMLKSRKKRDYTRTLTNT